MEYKLASSTWESEELNAIQRVINSGIFSMDKEVHEYEKRFADYFNSKHCVMVNSGSSANLLMIAALFFTKDIEKKLSQGDEVIVPAVSWSTTYFPLQQYGLKLVFVDIDSETLNFNLDALSEAITDKTKAILAVNLLGNPNDFSAIENLINGREIVLLEDNCESMGAKFNGQYTGTFGAMGTFSSFFSHHIATMEGGCILTDDEELYHIMLSLRAHGWTRNLPKKNHVTGTKSDNDFDESFNFVLPGYNLRPLEMSAAIGTEQLKKLPSFVASRRDNAKYFQELFSNHAFISTQKEIGLSSWFGFSLLLKEDAPLNRKSLIKLLSNNHIECRPIVSGNFLKNKAVLEFFDYRVSGTLPNAENLDKKGLFIGNHHFNIKENIKFLINLLKS